MANNHQQFLGTNILNQNHSNLHDLNYEYHINIPFLSKFASLTEKAVSSNLKFYSEPNINYSKLEEIIGDNVFNSSFANNKLTPIPLKDLKEADDFNTFAFKNLAEKNEFIIQNSKKL